MKEIGNHCQSNSKAEPVEICDKDVIVKLSKEVTTEDNSKVAEFDLINPDPYYNDNKKERNDNV